MHAGLKEKVTGNFSLLFSRSEASSWGHPQRVSSCNCYTGSADVGEGVGRWEVQVICSYRRMGEGKLLDVSRYYSFLQFPI